VDRPTKRTLLYIVVGVILYGTATLFVESKTGFIVLFGLGVLAIVAAEVTFWAHTVRVSLKRRHG
jgi:uncharacterized membrane protein